MIAIIDYGVGNLFSLRSSLKHIGVDAIVTGNIDDIRSAERLILPGVGAFEDAIKKLRSCKLDIVIKEEVAKGKPLLGICLGMQMLFEQSYEYGVHEGLGLIPGRVIPISDALTSPLKIPHIGWNALSLKQSGGRLLKHLNPGDHVYFVHSYYASDCDQYVIATTEYGATLTAAVERGNVFGCQFHPEKSGDVGLSILRSFCTMEDSYEDISCN